METKQFFLDIYYVSDFHHYSSVDRVLTLLNKTKYKSSQMTTYHSDNGDEYIFVTNFNIRSLYDYFERVSDVCGFDNKFSDGLTFNSIEDFQLALDAAHISYKIECGDIEDAIERDSKSLNVITKHLTSMLNSDDYEMNDIAKHAIITKYLTNDTTNLQI